MSLILDSFHNLSLDFSLLLRDFSNSFSAHVNFIRALVSPAVLDDTGWVVELTLMSSLSFRDFHATEGPLLLKVFSSLAFARASAALSLRLSFTRSANAISRHGFQPQTLTWLGFLASVPPAGEWKC
jgi:hypothetical protein